MSGAKNPPLVYEEISIEGIRTVVDHDPKFVEPPLDLQSLKETIENQKIRVGGWDRVASIRVSPDVFHELQKVVVKDPDLHLPPDMFGYPMHGIDVVVDKYLPKGTLIPLDAEGRPIPKPKAP